MRPINRSAVAIGWACTILGPASLAAQAPPAAADSGKIQTQAPFFTRNDLMLAGTFAVATMVMFPLDKQLAEGLQKPSNNTVLKHASTGVEVIASPGAYFIGGGLFVLGSVSKHPRIADLGWHGSEAVLLADAVTSVIKGIAGRSRPFMTAGSQPNNFDLGKGFGGGDYASFPSGHTTTAFAAAAAVTQETARWWPKSKWLVGTLMYGGATAVGASRMYHNRHWASDVVVGAAIGTFSGLKVVQYTHGHPANRLDRLMLRTAVVPDGHGGYLLALSMPTK